MESKGFNDTFDQTSLGESEATIVLAIGDIYAKKTFRGALFTNPDFILLQFSNESVDG